MLIIYTLLLAIVLTSAFLKFSPEQAVDITLIRSIVHRLFPNWDLNYSTNYLGNSFMWSSLALLITIALTPDVSLYPLVFASAFFYGYLNHICNVTGKSVEKAFDDLKINKIELQKNPLLLFTTVTTAIFLIIFFIFTSLDHLGFAFW